MRRERVSGNMKGEGRLMGGEEGGSLGGEENGYTYMLEPEPEGTWDRINPQI